jgi:hypothetical protein
VANFCVSDHPSALLYADGDRRCSQRFGERDAITVRGIFMSWRVQKWVTKDKLVTTTTALEGSHQEAELGRYRTS